MVVVINGMRGKTEWHRAQHKHENDAERKDNGLFESHHKLNRISKRYIKKISSKSYGNAQYTVKSLSFSLASLLGVFLPCFLDIVVLSELILTHIAVY